MAFWGVGLTESDEFCEAYEEYICMYEIGDEPEYITNFLLNKYISEYGEEKNVPHNIYFAIAKAEWMLCSQSEKVLSKVRDIIEKDENIQYYRSLGFSELELIERKSALLKFFEALNKTKDKPKKRKISIHNKLKRLPKGTVSYYEADGGFYGFVVLDALYEGRFIAVTEKLSVTPKTKEEILYSKALTAVWLLLCNVPKCYNLGITDITGNYNGRGGVFICKAGSIGINNTSYLEESHKRGLLDLSKHIIKDLFQPEKIPIKFFREETEKAETKLVLELMKNPASEYARKMIRKMVYLEGFFK